MEQKKIIIDYLYFHFVDMNKESGTLRKGQIIKIPAEVHEIYSQYIALIANKGDSQKAYNIYPLESPAARRTQKEIASMLKRPIPQEAEEFNKSAVGLASELIDFMKGTARPGVLFEILFTYAGRRYLCFLKLDWVDESFCEYDEESLTMNLKQLVQELPARGRFQKGGIYPHPVTPSIAYMRVYQDDAEANYFERFLGGMPEVSGREIMKELRRLSATASGEPLTLDQSMGLFSGLEVHVGESQKMVTEADVARIIQDALPSQSKKAITGIVQRDIRKTGLIRAIQVANLKISFKVGRLEIGGSFRDVQESFEEKGNNQHIIRGSISSVRLKR